VTGERQAAKSAPSSEHSKLEPASSELKVRVASVSAVVASGPESIEVSGARASITDQLWVAGDSSLFPA
jgi:hypothetical protein